jgi:hypothetical protein
MNDDISQRDQSEAILMVDDQDKPGRVKPWASLGRISLSDWAACGLEKSEYVLNIAGVHQDAITREWATRVADRAIQLVGECSVRSTWWKIGGLSDPRVFRDAVQAAATADILIVSVLGADALPLDLYEWIDAWLPLRLQLAGAMVALIGVPGQPGADSSRIEYYLQDVARRGQLEFLSQHQELPLALPDFSLGEIAERASATT